MNNSLSEVLKELTDLKAKQVNEYESLVQYLTAYDSSKLSNSQKTEDINHHYEN